MTGASGNASGLIERIKTVSKLPLGFGILLAWYYTTYFSCALASYIRVIRQSERFWGLMLLVVACAAVIYFLLSKKLIQYQTQKKYFVLASVGTTLASALIFVSYLGVEHALLFIRLSALIAGLSIPFLLLFWGELFKRYDTEIIELAVPAAFLVGIGIYFPLVALKGTVSSLVICLLPLISAYLGIRILKDAEALGMEAHNFLGAPVTCETTSPVNAYLEKTQYKITPELIKTGALFVVLWFNFAFFRTMASPAYFSDRFNHYLYPFLSAVVVAALVLRVVLQNARTIDLRTTYRWVLPCIVGSYALLFLQDNTLGRFAFTLSFVGLAGMQICTIMIEIKYAKTHGIPLSYLILPLLFAVGLGGSAGVFAGLRILQASVLVDTSKYLLLVMVVVVTAIMLWGTTDEPFVSKEEVDACDYTRKKQANEHEVKISVPMKDTGALIDNVATSQALFFGEKYGLSPRETEILGYLLAGWSRPYIRDSLFISLNTVNTHVRNIYNKMEVHSQQELLTLAREAQEHENASTDVEVKTDNSQ